MKVRLVIEGNVQGTGYRALIKNVARRLGIKGLVRNLDDGNVEVFCECDENTLKKFIRVIDRKGNPEQPFSLNVEKINVYKEGNVNCVGLPEKFGLFETDYRMKIDSVHKESLERSEIGIMVLSSMHQDLKEGQDDLTEGQKGLIGGQKDLVEGQKDLVEGQKDLVEGQKDLVEGQKDLVEGQKDLVEGQKDLVEGQKAMHQDMNKSFNQLNETIGTKFESMDVKYGDISKTMREMHNDLKEMKDLFAKLVNHIVKE